MMYSDGGIGRDDDDDDADGEGEGEGGGDELAGLGGAASLLESRAGLRIGPAPTYGAGQSRDTRG
jgi:hypothetical protein